MASPPTCLVPDRWLGALLERAAYRLDLPPAAAEDGLPAVLSAALATLDAAPSLATCKVPVARVAALAHLTRAGFVVIDTNVVLAKPPGAPALDPRCRLATPADEVAVTALAACCFRFSRFHLDPRIGAPLAHRLKAEWTRSYFRGQRGDKLVVAELAGRLVGFNQLLRGPHGERVIDLIGVHPDCRRQGVGRALCLAAEHFADGATEMLVGTQIANIPSLRLYEGLGYRVAQAQYVLHRHSPHAGACG